MASWVVRDACPIETQGYVYARVTARKQWILDNTNGTQDSNCTIDIEPALKSNADEDSLPVDLIAGVSAAALLIAAIIIAGVCCWKKDKCCCWRRDSEVVEENEMYGQGDYAQYDKDAYDTKIVDGNDYYGSDVNDD